MNNEIKINTVLNSLAMQRNSALDVVADLEGTIAVLQDENTKLKDKVKILEDKLSKVPCEPIPTSSKKEKLYGQGTAQK